MNVDDPEVQEFIRQSMVARIATLWRSGRPSITPLYFSYMHGHIWLGTASWTLAAREANADPRVCILFQHERNRQDPRTLRVTGTAIVRPRTTSCGLVIANKRSNMLCLPAGYSTKSYICSCPRLFVAIVLRAPKKDKAV